MKNKTPKGKRGWKVVRPDNPGLPGLLYSAITSSPRDGRVVYVPGEITRPRLMCGPLAVFRKRQDAEKFVEEERPAYPGLLIMPCTYKSSLFKSLWWAGSKEIRTPLSSLPKGTALASWVMIEKE